MLYTMEDIAKMFQVNYRTVGNWIKEGKIESFKINNLVRITEASLQKFLEDTKNEK